MKTRLYNVLAMALCALVSANAAQAHPIQEWTARPIPLGTSGGSIDDWATKGRWMYCCGGTLGALVEDPAGTLYVLSNNHVLAQVNEGILGDDVVQPGILDACPSVNPADAVADLSDFVPISWSQINLVDAAIAQIRPGQVDTSGLIHDIGTISADTLTAYPGLAVKKAGRTTGLTHGTVTAVDVTVTVGYTQGCASNKIKSATFINQIMIEPGAFSAGGDSGSLIVEDVPGNPRAVGLLFAGNSVDTIGNPIDAVLSALGVSMSGGTPEVCGNGSCSSAENECNCPADCGDPPATETNCSDGIDDDCDGSTDCADGDCAPDAACACGDGICNMALGEDCRTCPDDCNSKTRGKPSSRYCCGADVDCGDARCSGNGNVCSQDAVGIESNQPGRAHPSEAALQRAGEIKRRNSDRLFAIPDLVGHGIGLAQDGSLVVEVYLSRENMLSRRQIPAMLEDIPVVIIVKGPFLAR